MYSSEISQGIHMSLKFQKSWKGPEFLLPGNMSQDLEVFVLSWKFPKTLLIVFLPELAFMNRSCNNNSTDVFRAFHSISFACYLAFLEIILLLLSLKNLPRNFTFHIKKFWANSITSISPEVIWKWFSYNLVWEGFPWFPKI